MKKLYICILFSVTYCLASAQIPNAGFESWASSTSPNSWTASGVTQVTPGNSGTYAAKGTVTGTTAPNLQIPNLTYFNIPQPYNTFQFYYKGNFVTADAIFITVSVYSASGIQVGSVPAAYRTIITPSANFIQFTAPITYSNPSAAAKASIAFTVHYTTGGNVHDGTYFIVDDISMSGIVGVNEISDNIKAQIFPNPVHDDLQIRMETDDHKPAQIKLTDLLGRTVLERESTLPVNGIIEESMSVVAFPRGIYFLTLVSDKKTLVRRISVD